MRPAGLKANAVVKYVGARLIAQGRQDCRPLLETTPWFVPPQKGPGAAGPAGVLDPPPSPGDGPLAVEERAGTPTI